jgi:hypothetical protein
VVLGRRKREQQQELWVATGAIDAAPGHVFCQRLNDLLQAEDFDEFVEELCRPHDARGRRPGAPPGIASRMLFIDDFEGIDSQRGIVWRCRDSLSRFCPHLRDRRSPADVASRTGEDQQTIFDGRRRSQSGAVDAKAVRMRQAANGFGGDLCSAEPVRHPENVPETDPSATIRIRRRTSRHWGEPQPNASSRAMPQISNRLLTGRKQAGS